MGQQGIRPWAWELLQEFKTSFFQLPKILILHAEWSFEWRIPRSGFIIWFVFWHSPPIHLIICTLRFITPTSNVNPILNDVSCLVLRQPTLVSSHSVRTHGCPTGSYSEGDIPLIGWIRFEYKSTFVGMWQQVSFSQPVMVAVGSFLLHMSVSICVVTNRNWATRFPICCGPFTYIGAYSNLP